MRLGITAGAKCREALGSCAPRMDIKLKTTATNIRTKEPYPDGNREYCPKCSEPAEFWGVTVYATRSGKPSVEIYYCEDCGEFEL